MSRDCLIDNLARDGKKVWGMFATREGVVMVLTSLWLVSCGSLEVPAASTITFTKLPPFGEGTAYHSAWIEGRATGVRPGEKVVLYARSGTWWIQPLSSAPFTPLQPDSSWRNKTHPGAAYAALLVDGSYVPRVRMDVLPEKGGPVLAVVTAEGTPPTRPPGKNLLFSGYEWRVREIASNPAGSPNDYDPANAWTDAEGSLHLRIAQHADAFAGAEVNLSRSLGYGSYRFVVRNASHLDAGAAFAMSVMDDGGPSQAMNIEISKWGQTDAAHDGQFVIQPYHVPANTVQFQTPKGPATFMFTWAPGRASFKAFRGVVSDWDTPAVREHVFTSGVPSAGSDSIHMNLYVFRNNSHPLTAGTEVTIEKFEYLP